MGLRPQGRGELEFCLCVYQAYKSAKTDCDTMKEVCLLLILEIGALSNVWQLRVCRTSDVWEGRAFALCSLGNLQNWLVNQGGGIPQHHAALSNFLLSSWKRCVFPPSSPAAADFGRLGSKNLWAGGDLRGNPLDRTSYIRRIWNKNYSSAMACWEISTLCDWIIEQMHNQRPVISQETPGATKPLIL